MKIVEFKDGTYGIRRFSWRRFSYEYKDISSYNRYWWPSKDIENFNLGCKTSDADKARMYFYALTDRGAVLK